MKTNGIKGQVIFQFVFDIAWEIHIPRLLKSDVFSAKGWKIKEESQ